MSWKGYEKRKARERRGTHIGGPGAPDFIRGHTDGEVKSWKKPMGRAAVMREAQKGRTEIVSKSGFTEDAIAYAEKYRPGLRLIHGNKTVKPRRRQKDKGIDWASILVAGIFLAILGVSIFGRSRR